MVPDTTHIFKEKIHNNEKLFNCYIILDNMTKFLLICNIITCCLVTHCIIIYLFVISMYTIDQVVQVVSQRFVSLCCTALLAYPLVVRQYCFVYHVISFWNLLPTDAQTATNFSKFNSMLKHLPLANMYRYLINYILIVFVLKTIYCIFCNHVI